MRIKKIIIFIVALAMLLLFCVSFFSSPKVLAIHGPEANKELLVKNIPFTDSDKIEWWDNNGVKTISSPETYNVSIWKFDGKYQKLAPRNSGAFPDHDTDYLLCFDDMKTEENCIDKSTWIMEITKTKDGYTYYRLDGKSYYRKPSGELVKGERFTTTIKPVS
ncbi:DUF943 family protein [Pantoea agglomerans]|jgi:hypothetical protein|uniref:DUF943 family protein n=1 Tax=Enterobacter agglomerans TaxID=549 RepID=UPI00050DBD73|nr:DUF943 family protein [Pantoea agglomerans]KGD73914.1 hypothetical protein ID10_15985 [Pantoea agglomerans]MDY0903065.1 DUF943 family protein [Pantoea agglomerans]MVT83164.1 DUF943 family protein [Pantoea agglomerans]WLO84745.1 DUF943 family protein [Pantoea agglomerans]